MLFADAVVPCFSMETCFVKQGDFRVIVQHLPCVLRLCSDCHSTGRQIVRWWLWWAIVGCLLWASYSNDAQAAKRDNIPSNVSANSSKHPKVHIRTRTQRSSSEESQRERDQRLRRECRGRPNAGACLGYAHR